tara:strand:- start:199 stop:2184 length:1986 start_codon:yes stop_codon:yes gene_type:complete
MSYIVCSNDQRDYDKDGNNDNNGLSKPASFRNFFKSPLVIEPNSEIALQSIKIRKPTDTTTISPNDHIFLYFGKEFDDDPASLYEQGQTPRTAVPVYFKTGSYNPQQFRTELERAINAAPLPPGLFGRTSVEVEYDADNQLDGYKITFDHIKTGTDKSGSYGTINSTTGQVPALPNAVFATDGYTWDTGGGTPIFSPDSDTPVFPAASILTNFPMANASTSSGRSEIEFVISDRGGLFTRTNDTQWAVGLTRPLDGRFHEGQPKYSHIENDWMGYFDYYAYFDELEGGLFVGEYNTAVIDGVGGKTLRSRDIEYFGAGRPFTSRINASEIADKDLDTIRFILNGDKMKLAIGESGGSFYDLVDPDNASLNDKKRGRFKPINNNTEALYPKLVWAGEDRDTDCDIEVAKLQVFVNDNFVYPNFHQEGSFSRGSDFATRYGANPAPRAAGHKNLGLITDQRPATNAANVDTSTFTYVTNAVSASGTIDYKHVIVQGKESAPDMSLESGTTYTLAQQAAATMNGALGYGKNVAVLEQSEFGAYTDGKAVFTPKEPPLKLEKSLYVRLNNLPFTSFNGTTNSISKIIYSIPPYDVSGNDRGVVYHEPHEKTYIKLNNPDKLVLNELDTDIVTRRERITEDLEGSTSVTYHIRQSKDPISNQSQLF